jgi:predicted benzoate:H+ symporter BenE
MLALLGVAAGMFLQVRAFLYCGVTFVLVALVGMVRQAAQAIEQVWPWWAFGIATGILLIVALGYLEKNRSQVLGYLEELKRWQQ